MAAAVRLGPALPGQAPELSRIARAAKAALGYAPELLRAWHAELLIDAETIRRHQVRVAWCGEAIVGFFCLSCSGAEARIEHLWVDPCHQRRGIGAALLEEAVRLAAERGAAAVEADAEPSAEAFYRLQGFERVTTLAAPIPGEAARVRPQMRRRLPS